MLQAFRSILPGFSGTVNPIVMELNELSKLWSSRNSRFDDWYRLLNQEDQLFQANMESFVGNDPRTTWNMGTYLLQPRPFNHKIVTVDGTILPTQITPFANVVQKYFANVWSKIDTNDIRRGRQSWFWTMIGFLLATGWYSIPYTVDNQGEPWADYWNPYNVFPDFSDDAREGMVRLGVLKEISAGRAKDLARKNNWQLSKAITGRTLHGKLWKKHPDGVITYDEVLNNQVVFSSILSGFIDIPVLVGMTGGIPGGVNKTSETAEGQSILATNEKIFMNLNKQMTFMQQLLRDTANPRWWEKVVGNKSVIGDPDNLFKRGAKFTMGVNEDMGAIQMPAIPVELTQIVFNLRNQLQRGGFSDLTFGNVLSRVSAVLVSQAAEAAQQLLYPYHTAIQYAISEVTNNWYRTLLKSPQLWPDNWSRDIDIDVLENTKIVSSYSVRIPGDLTNRINQAKQLNPEFRLPTEQVMRLLLPEVSDPVEAMSRLDGEQAKKSPEYTGVVLINSFVQLAREAAAVGNTQDAALYTILASNIRERISQQPGATAQTGVDVNSVPNLASQRTGVGR